MNLFTHFSIDYLNTNTAYNWMFAFWSFLFSLAITAVVFRKKEIRNAIDISKISIFLSLVLFITIAISKPFFDKIYKNIQPHSQMYRISVVLTDKIVKDLSLSERVYFLEHYADLNGFLKPYKGLEKCGKIDQGQSEREKCAAFLKDIISKVKEGDKNTILSDYLNRKFLFKDYVEALDKLNVKAE